MSNCEMCGKTVQPLGDKTICMRHYGKQVDTDDEEYPIFECAICGARYTGSKIDPPIKIITMYQGGYTVEYTEFGLDVLSSCSIGPEFRKSG